MTAAGSHAPVDYAGLRTLLDRGAQLVEVLPEPEYTELHLPEAVNIPLGRMDETTVAALDRTTPIVVYCWDGL